MSSTSRTFAVAAPGEEHPQTLVAIPPKVLAGVKPCVDRERVVSTLQFNVPVPGRALAAIDKSQDDRDIPIPHSLAFVAPTPVVLPGRCPNVMHKAIIAT